MHIRIATWWDAVRSSYWFVPSLMVTGSIALAAGAVWVDRNYDLASVPLIGYFGSDNSGAAGVRDLLNAVAGGMISLAGVTFSITIVALSLASQQFGPRLLYNFMRDRGNQITLGTFIATFVYAIFLLRAADSTEFIPSLSVTIAIVLMLAAVAVLIYFFHHVSASLQADNVVAAVAEDLNDTIDRICDVDAPRSTDAGRAALQSDDAGAPEETIHIRSDRAGYIQSIDEPSLVDWAKTHDVTIRLHKRAGHFAVHDEVLAEYWPPRTLDEKAAAYPLKCFTFGNRRTHVQDLEFGMEQLVEIAVRSLSPSINDPFTARLCVDRIGEALAHLAQRGTPQPCWRDELNRLRLITNPTDFPGMVDVAFNQVRQNVLPHVSIIIRMLESIELTARFCSSAETRDPLLAQTKLIMQLAEREIKEPHDLAAVRDRFEEAQRQLQSRSKRDAPSV